MDPAQVCRLFFALGTAVGLGGTLIPSFREQIMDYGSRSIKQNPLKKSVSKTKLSNLLNYIASFQVPHTWFTHYYAVSVVSSIFWAHQILTHGQAFKFLASHSQQASSSSMTANQVLLAMCFMSIQGIRRLYESITLTKPSRSKMWVGLWVIGIAYYIFMGITVWIEGISALNTGKSLARLLEFSNPSLKTTVAVPLFLLASGIQYYCHKHLASLKKYTLPEHDLFQSIVCPHYTSECLIYVAIAIVASSNGQVMNRTVLAGLCFVVSNLAVTADSTRKRYIEMFGEEQLKGRWRMIPYIY